MKGWIRQYGIKTVINAPCGNNGDAEMFRQLGVTEVLPVDKIGGANPSIIVGDLQEWKPVKPYDAVYQNGSFNPAYENVDDGRLVMENIATWPVKYILIYDMSLYFDWTDTLSKAGWKLLADGPSTDSVGAGKVRCEIWTRANEA